jgi:cystathionine beta-synthase
MKVANNILELIGNTPVVKVGGLDTNNCDLFVKLEYQNPGGSIKDRMALYMINDAKMSGRLGEGQEIVEASAGNTGIGLALVARRLGHKVTIIVPDKMAELKVKTLKALGAETIVTRSDVGKGHPEYYQDLAEKMAKDRRAFYINQFENPSNALAHETMTAPEIWRQMNNDLDAIVVGVGSSGTITGISRFFRKVAPNLKIILADPSGSILKEFIEEGEIKSTPGSWLVEGIGEDFIPTLSDFSMVSHAYSVTDEESFLTARELFLSDGIMGGSSTGTLVAAALKYCQTQNKRQRVLTFACDTGNRYLDKFYDEEWMDNFKV